MKKYYHIIRYDITANIGRTVRIFTDKAQAENCLKYEIASNQETWFEGGRKYFNFKYRNIFGQIENHEGMYYIQETNKKEIIVFTF